MAAVAALIDDFRGAGAEVVAVSTDSVYSHKIFAQTSPSAKKINYPLMSDRSQKISRAYGVLDETTGTAYRATFIIDPEGNVVYYSVYPREVGRSAPEILRTLKGIQYGRQSGEGVPAGWKPGDPGIRRDWDKVGTV